MRVNKRFDAEIDDEVVYTKNEQGQDGAAKLRSKLYGWARWNRTSKELSQAGCPYRIGFILVVIRNAFYS